MHLTLITIGRPRSKATRALIDEYGKRLSRYGRFEHIIVSDRQKGDAQRVRQQQSDALIDAVPGRAKIVALDERGETWTSEQLSKRMANDALHGQSHWALLIGGSDGHDPSLRQRADALWSLSKLTLPHDLAAIVVAEQLYRAMTIQRGEPYHRGG